VPPSDQLNRYNNLPLASAALQAEIADLIVRVAFYNDRGEYDLLAQCLAPEIIVDAVSLFGGEIETVGRDEQIRRYQSRLPGCDFNQHLVFCAEVRTMGENHVIAWSNFRATHRYESELWTVAGVYTHQLEKTEKWGWQITAIKIDLGYEEGSRMILDKAADRLAARAQADGPNGVI
jgi:SnoaL-like domain